MYDDVTCEAILIAAHEPAALFDALFLLSYVGDLIDAQFSLGFSLGFGLEFRV
jgi:hypothetical protein